MSDDLQGLRQGRPVQVLHHCSSLTGEHYLSLASGDHHRYLALQLQLQLIYKAHQLPASHKSVSELSFSSSCNLAALQLAGVALITQAVS